MNFVIGVDLGTSAVKSLLVDANGRVAAEASRSYPLSHPRSGWSEQNPQDWVQATIESLAELAALPEVKAGSVDGISFSGQMHGLVLLGEDNKPVRPAILWNDTRTTEQCRHIEQVLGDKLLGITRNPALEGFTLPKLLWVRQYEPEVFAKGVRFVLPKDYVRYCLTGELHMDYSDAAGTLLLDVAGKEWSKEVAAAFDLSPDLFVPLVESHAHVGNLLPEVAQATGLTDQTKIFAGGADNACGAIGAGILSEGLTLCSIGTSGVILSYEENREQDYKGKVHFFNHGQEDAFYSMGVTLAAGYSLSWFKQTFAKNESFAELTAGIDQIPPGSAGLLYTPYLVGERTPHPDSQIRASFIGMDSSHERAHFARAVIEGITFSLAETVEVFRAAGKNVDTVVSIGGGAQNPVWLQIQADIFGARVVGLENEQGPGLGAAMLAAYGAGWFETLTACADVFVKHASSYEPQPEAVAAYRKLLPLYQQVYHQTKDLSAALAEFRA